MYKCLFYQAEDGIRDLVRSRGLGDVYKRQVCEYTPASFGENVIKNVVVSPGFNILGNKVIKL